MSGADAQIPIIDISALIAGDPAGEKAIAQSIGAACRGIGFFCITGHGISPETTTKVFEGSAEFFRSPASIKDAVSFSGAGGNRGFIRLGEEKLDPGKPSDVKEAFNIGLELSPTDPDLLARKPFRALNVWPKLPGFRDVMLDYYERVWRVSVTLHRAFALDLGLDAAYFAGMFRKPMATLRLLHYPPVATPLAEGQMGAGEHTDYGNVTLLATDSVGGLMVRDRTGRWLDAPIVPGALICNIGDCLMRWTNDIYVSTPHKVVAPPGADRYSIAFFLDPDPEVLVDCLPTCANAERPARYPSVTASDFLRSRLEPTYAHKKAG